VLLVHFPEAFPEKDVMGVDQDEAAVSAVSVYAREFIECQRLVLKCGRFSQMRRLLTGTFGPSATAGLILFDLGYSNAQVKYIS
jgi:16S rRNA C1402 N4-methylase RsmH